MLYRKQQLVWEATGNRLNKLDQVGVEFGEIKLKCRWRGRLHISLRYLHILAKEYYKAGA